MVSPSRALAAALLLLPVARPLRAEDGHALWLRYRPVSDAGLLITSPGGVARARFELAR